MKDVKIEYYKSGGPGGQHKNKRNMAVRVTHVLSGLSAVGQEERSQARNKVLALDRLKKKLIAKNRRQKPRIPTRQPHGVKERVLEWKRKRKVKKEFRGKDGLSEEI